MDELEHVTFEIFKEGNLTENYTNYTDYSTYKIGVWIENIYFPLLMVLGLPGNVVTVTVMMKPSNQHLSYCWYVAFLVISDSAMLITYFVFWVQSQFEDALNEHFCKGQGFFFYWFSTTSIYMILCLTVERYLVNKHRHDILEWRLPSRAKLHICLIYLVTCVLNIPHIFTENMVDSQSCGEFYGASLPLQVYAIFRVLVFLAIPVVSVLVLNIRTILSIRREGFHGGERQVTRMLLFLSFTFIILLLPQFIRNLVYSFLAVHSPQQHAVFVLVHNVTNMLYLTNNAINFYLYGASVAIFRKDTVDLLRCRPCRTPGYQDNSGFP